MSTFTKWLESEMTFSREIVLSTFFVLACLVIYLALGTIFKYPFMWELLTEVAPYSTMMMAKNALGEEAAFRLVPGLVIFSLIKDKQTAIILFFLISPLFAYLHIGMLSLFVLGPISLIFTLTYLKFGGVTGNHLRGFLFAGTIHVATNVSIHGCARFF
jgi:hypothetical protein